MHYLIYATLIAVALMVGACEQEGPAERAGKSIDHAVEKAGDRAEDIGDDIEDATD